MTVRPKMVVSKEEANVRDSKSIRWLMRPTVDTPHDITCRRPPPSYVHSLQHGPPVHIEEENGSRRWVSRPGWSVPLGPLFSICSSSKYLQLMQLEKHS